MSIGIPSSCGVRKVHSSSRIQSHGATELGLNSKNHFFGGGGSTRQFQVLSDFLMVAPPQHLAKMFVAQVKNLHYIYKQY